MSLGVMEPYFTEVLRLREVGQYESHQMTSDRTHAPLHQSSSLQPTECPEGSGISKTLELDLLCVHFTAGAGGILDI